MCNQFICNYFFYQSNLLMTDNYFYVKVLFNTTHTLLSSIVEKRKEWTHRTMDLKEENSSINSTEAVYKIQCFPLYSILLAIGKTKIDYFGLDVEGSEYKILKTIPWHKVDIKVITLFYKAFRKLF